MHVILSLILKGDISGCKLGQGFPMNNELLSILLLWLWLLH